VIDPWVVEVERVVGRVLGVCAGVAQDVQVDLHLLVARLLAACPRAVRDLDKYAGDLRDLRGVVARVADRGTHVHAADVRLRGV